MSTWRGKEHLQQGFYKRTPLLVRCPSWTPGSMYRRGMLRTSRALRRMSSSKTSPGSPTPGRYRRMPYRAYASPLTRERKPVSHAQPVPHACVVKSGIPKA